MTSALGGALSLLQSETGPYVDPSCAKIDECLDERVDKITQC